MTKLRVIIFIISFLVVGTIATATYQYARGYRLDQKNLKLTPSGLLVANSDPNGAQVFVNGDLKTATNNTISLIPGTYDVVIKKEGFLPWEKRLVIEKEIVTQVDVNLFTLAPSLSALTFSGARNPIPTGDFSKIAYYVPALKDNEDKQGLWVIEATNLPIGFSREPRRITDGDLSEASWKWSPDSREILLTTKNSVFLLDISQFTPQHLRINVASKIKTIEAEWAEKSQKRLKTKMSKLPDELEEIFERIATEVEFSPDENKILYTATEPARIPEDFIKALPGSSTQKQVREVKVGYKYVFDIKEDRNFEVGVPDEIIYWFPTSRHLVLPQKERIIIEDCDGTNKKEVFSGSYVFPYTYPYSSTTKLLILTNLGAQDSLPDLYSLNLR